MFAVWNNLRATARGSLLLCLLAGAVFSLPYRWEAAYPATYLALICFFLLLQTDPLQNKPFRACFCFCLGYLLPLYTWFTALYSVSALGYSKGALLGLVLLCCLGIPLVQAAVQAAVLQFGRFLPHGKTGAAPFLRAIGYGALWVVSETVLSFGALGLPWGTIALSQTGCSALLATVSLFGAKWLAFFAVTICMLLAGAWLCNRKALLISGSALFAAAILVGAVLQALPSGSASQLPVAAIQGNCSVNEKWQGQRLQQIFQTYQRLTREAAEAGAKLILLPESAVPTYFEENGVQHQAFAAIAREYDCTILLGVLRQTDDGTRSSLIAIEPDGSLSDAYDKQHLVPFGEFVPLKPLIASLFPAAADLNLNETLVAGDTAVSITAADLTIGCLICYDSIFSAPAQARADIDICVIATNDAWFGESSALFQHLRYASLRAAEIGSSVLRAGNTGISAIVDCNGRRIAQTTASTEAILYGDLPVGGRQTLFGLTGDLIVPLSVLLLLLLLPAGLFTAVRTKRRPSDP